MKPPSCAGFKDGLERAADAARVHRGPGTMISFGPHDNRGYKGDYIVLRTVRDGVEQRVDAS